MKWRMSVGVYCEFSGIVPTPALPESDSMLPLRLPTRAMVWCDSVDPLRSPAGGISTNVPLPRRSPTFIIRATPMLTGPMSPRGGTGGTGSGKISEWPGLEVLLWNVPIVASSLEGFAIVLGVLEQRSVGKPTSGLAVSGLTLLRTLDAAAPTWASEPARGSAAVCLFAVEPALELVPAPVDDLDTGRSGGAGPIDIGAGTATPIPIAVVSSPFVEGSEILGSMIPVLRRSPEVRMRGPLRCAARACSSLRDSGRAAAGSGGGTSHLSI